MPGEVTNQESNAVQTDTSNVPRGAETVVDETPDNQNESAADRALARKKLADAASKMEKKQKDSGKNKIKSLADLKKLHSDHVGENKKTNSVEVDNEALPNPKLEPGRPEPKVPSKRARQSDDLEEQPTVRHEVETEPVDSNETDPSDEEQSEDTHEETTEQELSTDYKPNLKYKAYGEEFDIPEMFQSLIKDPESERAVHEVFEKSHAFEKTKAKYLELDQAVKEKLVPQLQNFNQVREDLMESAQNGDIFGLLRKFGIDERKVLQAAAKHVELLEAGPEVRAEYEARIKAQEQAKESERRLAYLEAQAIESARTAKSLTFQTLLARDDVKALKDDFDQKLGKTGSFERMVAQYADRIYRDSAVKAHQGLGRVIDLTPEQAITGFMEEFGLKFPEAKKTPQALQKKPETKPIATQAPAPKVIPNIRSKNITNTDSKPVFKNASDIAAYRKQRFGR